MADFETKLRWLSERGDPVGAEELIERIEAELAGDPLVVVTKRREGTPMTKTQQPPTTNQPRRHRGPAWAVAAFVAVLAVAGIYLAFAGDEPDIAETPDDPVATATAFVEAYTTGDADTAAAFLAADAHFEYTRLADTGSFSGDFSDLGVEGLSLIARFDEAVGMTWLPGPCELQSSTSAGSNVVCPYDLHGFHSDERGLGPYSGSAYRILILDGKVTSFIDIPRLEDENAWQVENWDAFNTWGRETHPEDWATLDNDEAITSLIATSPDQAIEMYERLMRDFVEFENQSGTPDDPVATATAFVEAYTTGDADTAAAFLAADAHFEYTRLADTGSFSGDFSDLGVEGLSLIARFDEAVGMTWLPGPCELQSSTSAGSNVVCPYDLHGFHSDERGLGPYSGSAYRILILDGKVTSFIDIPRLEDENAWQVENWDAFNTWGRETHPEDWATLDNDEAITSLIATSPDQAIEMYERLMRDFVEFENQGS